MGGSPGRDRNLLTVARNLSMRGTVGQARAATVSMVMPRYSTDCDGLRSDFSLLSTTPRELHRDR